MDLISTAPAPNAELLHRAAEQAEVRSLNAPFKRQERETSHSFLCHQCVPLIRVINAHTVQYNSVYLTLATEAVANINVQIIIYFIRQFKLLVDAIFVE